DGGMILQATDPHLMVMTSELALDRFRKEGDKYVNDIKSDMIAGAEDLKNFSRQKNATATLNTIKSKVKNDLLASFESTGEIADVYSRLYRFDKDPQVFDNLMESVDSLTPADIDAYAKTNFTASRRVVSTLWHD